MIDHYRMFAGYNAWANDLLYQAATDLSEEELHADKGAFFGSLFATLSHIVTADRAWMRRFTGEGVQPKSLDEKPCSRLEELREIRRFEDQRISNYVEGLDPEQLQGTISYSPISNPTLITHKLAPALAHLFNHQTHHRGQCHMTLTALGKPSLALDLIYFLRSDGKQWL